MSSINFGVLMIPFQALDVVGPLDILYSCRAPYISSLFNVPNTGIDITFHHINETMTPVSLTSNITYNPTTTCDVCPPLDYLLVGGPELTYDLPPRFQQFIRDHVARGKTLFTTCTGAYCVAQSGVLDGKAATTNHVCLEKARKRFPEVEWRKEQWVVDGLFWTAGGACAGMDMFAAWVVQEFGMEVAKGPFTTLDFAPRDIAGKVVEPREMYEVVVV